MNNTENIKLQRGFIQLTLVAFAVAFFSKGEHTFAFLMLVLLLFTMWPDY